MCGAEVYGKPLYFPLNFAVNLKQLLKNKVSIKINLPELFGFVICTHDVLSRAPL